MLKSYIKRFFHSLLGFERFLYYFSLFKIFTLRSDKNERSIFLFINELKRRNPTGILLDIGANIGIMCGVMARNTTYFIYAFEPLPLNYTILDKVITRLEISTRVMVYKMALGNYDGTCEMVLPVVDKVKMHGLSHVLDPAITEFNEGEKSARIPIAKLDTLLQHEPVAGIKMDVENFEFEVLKGAEQLLRKQKPIIYTELWDNENRQQCFTFLRGLGYQSFYNQNQSLVPFEGNNCKGQTFVFI